MAKFLIKTKFQDGSEGPALEYDNAVSSLVYAENRAPVAPPMPKREFPEAFAVSKDNPGSKTSPRTLKISLGLSCNYECSYCSQRFVPHAEQTNPDDIEPFLAQLTGSLTQAPQRIEFWGGEPFVYWKTLKPLAEKLRVLYPEADFNIITNGSLLDAEKNEWLDRLGFGVGISHDGPGYHVRGLDPMDDPEKREAIMDLYRRLHPQGRISLNAVMHNGNRSRAAVQEWHQERFGPDVQIGEGAFIDPYDADGLASTFQSFADHIEFRSQAFEEIRKGKVAQLNIVRQKLLDFVNSVRLSRPASAIGQKCGMDSKDNVAVDLNGNVLTCQNVSAAATSFNGESHKIGHITDLANVKLKTATHWSKREDCSNCPVLQICKGACMFLEGNLWDAACDAAFSDNVPFLAAGIEYMTGLTPYYIEGGREDRSDIFAKVHGIQEAPQKRVIKIHQAAPAAVGA